MIACAQVKGKFDMGWNELREQIFANQKKLGVIPEKLRILRPRAPVQN